MKNCTLCCLWILPLLAAAGPLEKGIEAKAKGDFPLATQELARAVQTQPQNPQAWYHYGVVLGWQDRHAEARAALDRGLAMAPADYDLRAARARVIAWQGDYALASAELAKLAQENPADNDVAVMQARVAGWQGRQSEAESIYRAVIARDPRQVDALSGLGDLARDRQNREEALGYYRQALAIDSSPDIQKRLDALENQTLMRWDAGISASTFSDSSRSDWWSAWTQFSRTTQWGSFWGRIEQGERFDEQDTTLEIGWEGKPADGWTARAFVGGSPDASWAPEWYAELGALWVPAAGWPALAAELRQAEYLPRGVFTLRTGVEYEIGDGWRGSVRWVHQSFENGEPTDGWILSLDKELKSGLAWRIGAASGAESLNGELLRGSSNVLRSRTWFGGIRGPFNDQWGWRMDVEFEDVQGGADRRGFSIGVQHKF